MVTKPKLYINFNLINRTPLDVLFLTENEKKFVLMKLFLKKHSSARLHKTDEISANLIHSLGIRKTQDEFFKYNIYLQLQN